MRDFEKLVDRIFEKFDIDFNFTKHFRDRMSDSRNDPCISIQELSIFLRKIYNEQAKSLKNVKDSEAILKDIQKDLNIPIVIEYDKKNDELDVTMKTIMRKKNFRSPNKVIRY